MTNLDRIRAMSAEELAEIIDNILTRCSSEYGGCKGCPFYDIVTCDCIGILEWLKSEVEE